MEKKIFNNSKFNGMPLGRAQLKHILGGVMPSVDCDPTDEFPVKKCAKNADGSDNCKAQCFVTCTDKCKQTNTQCLSNWTCGSAHD